MPRISPQRATCGRIEIGGIEQAAVYGYNGAE
jgi:hypothetical protein